MPALQIRDLPQGLYDELRLRAEREHRSLAQQATVAIEQHLRLVPPVEQHVHLVTEEDERQTRIARRKALFEEIHATPPVDVPDDFPSSADIVRGLRDSR